MAKQTIKTTIERKAMTLGLEDGYGRYIKSYNGFATLRVELLEDVELEKEETSVYYSEEFNSIVVRIMNIDTESKLLKIQNEKIDTLKKEDFRNKLKHYLKKYGKDFVEDLFEE